MFKHNKVRNPKCDSFKNSSAKIFGLENSKVLEGIEVIRWNQNANKSWQKRCLFKIKSIILILELEKQVWITNTLQVEGLGQFDLRNGQMATRSSAFESAHLYELTSRETN
jgi:hypothetical protein